MPYHELVWKFICIFLPIYFIRDSLTGLLTHRSDASRSAVRFVMCVCMMANTVHYSCVQCDIHLLQMTDPKRPVPPLKTVRTLPHTYTLPFAITGIADRPLHLLLRPCALSCLYRPAGSAAGGAGCIQGGWERGHASLPRKTKRCWLPVDFNARLSAYCCK